MMGLIVENSWKKFVACTFHTLICGSAMEVSEKLVKSRIFQKNHNQSYGYSKKNMILRKIILKVRVIKETYDFYDFSEKS